MGIDTVFHGMFCCNVDDLDDDFDIEKAWNKFKKKNNICWDLVDGEYIEASRNYREAPEFYVEKLIYLCNNFLKLNKIYVSYGSVVYECCTCGTLYHGVINLSNYHVKLTSVTEFGEITIKEYNDDGIETIKIDELKYEIDALKKRVEELETEIKYVPDGTGHKEAKKHFNKLRNKKK